MADHARRARRHHPRPDDGPPQIQSHPGGLCAKSEAGPPRAADQSRATGRAGTGSAPVRERGTRLSGIFCNTWPVKQSIVTLDLEGVLVPEIWIAVAEKTGIKELRRTTRDEPDYDQLMRGRLKILDAYKLKLSDIQSVIGALRPLPGGKEFLDELRSIVQVIILSDTFEQFATPLLHKLGWPTLLCHRLEVVSDRIVGCQIRIPEQKQQAVAAFKR